MLKPMTKKKPQQRMAPSISWTEPPVVTPGMACILRFDTPSATVHLYNTEGTGGATLSDGAILVALQVKHVHNEMIVRFLTESGDVVVGYWPICTGKPRYVYTVVPVPES